MRDWETRIRLATWSPTGDGAASIVLEGGGFGSVATQLARADRAETKFLLEEERKTTRRLIRENSRLTDEKQHLQQKLDDERERNRRLQDQVDACSPERQHATVDSEISRLQSVVERCKASLAKHNAYADHLLAACHKRAVNAKHISFSAQPLAIAHGIPQALLPAVHGPALRAWTPVGSCRPSFGRIIRSAALERALESRMTAVPSEVWFAPDMPFELPSGRRWDDFVFAGGIYWQPVGSPLSARDDPDLSLSESEKDALLQYSRRMSFGKMIEDETKRCTVRMGNTSLPRHWCVGQHHYAAVGNAKHLVYVTEKILKPLGEITDNELLAEGLPTGNVGRALLRRVMMALCSPRVWIRNDDSVWIVQFAVEKFRVATGI